MSKRRFFFHYRRQTGKMTLHWKGACISVDNVVCRVACETKWNKKMPKLVMRGWALTVDVRDGVATIL